VKRVLVPGVGVGKCIESASAQQIGSFQHQQPTPTPLHPTPTPSTNTGSSMLIDTTIPVRWRDLDAYNHVNNSLFLTFLEEARIQWFESFPEPWRCAAHEPILAAATINFRRPIQYPETLRVRLFCERVGRSSLTITHRITAAGDDEILYADGNTVVVWIGPADGRPLPLPEVVRRVVGASD
jgi:acyl-CoA thioester hydrolase